MSPRKATTPFSTSTQIVDAAISMVDCHAGELGSDERGASYRNGAMSTDTHDPAAHGAEVRRVHGRLLAEAGLSGSMVRTADGAAVHVVEKGTGPPVVFVHGSGSPGLFWLPLLRQVEGVRAIVVDRPGFGLSDPLPFRLIGTPGVRMVIAGQRETPSSFRRFAGMVGEGDTIDAHPDLVELMVAVGNDPVASRALQHEIGASSHRGLW